MTPIISAQIKHPAAALISLQVPIKKYDFYCVENLQWVARSPQGLYQYLCYIAIDVHPPINTCLDLNTTVLDLLQ